MMRFRIFFFWTSLVIVLSVAVALTLAFIKDGSKMLPSSPYVLGDFTSLYSASLTLRTEGPELVYDLNHQRIHQSSLSGGSADWYLPYAYPPFVAQLLIPFTFLSIGVAKWLWVVLMTLCVLHVISLISVVIPQFKSLSLIERIAMIIIIHPLSVGIIGGQNTGFSMWLLALALVALQKGTPKQEVFAGMILGFWLVKPHYPMMIFPVFVLLGMWRVLLGGALTALSLYFLAATQFGFDWPIEWGQVVLEFSKAEQVNNFNRLISIPSNIAYLLKSIGIESLIEQRIVFLIPLIGEVLMLYTVWRARHLRLPIRKNAALVLSFAALTAILFSPHAMYYDIGIALVAVIWSLRKFLNFKHRYEVVLGVLLITVWLPVWKAISINTITLFLLISYILVSATMLRSTPYGHEEL